MEMRSGFYCVICDYKNQKFISVPTKTVHLKDTSCEVITQNTIEFSHKLYALIFFPVLKLGKILDFFKTDDDMSSLKIPFFIEKLMAIKNCYSNYSSSGEAGTNCYNYCNFFKLNAVSNVIEGDINFLSFLITRLSQFIKTNEKYRPAILTRRVLSTSAAL